jgi:nucleoside transporter
MNVRLIQASVLLFLKYYILGAVYTTMGLVLGTHGLSGYIGASYSVGGFTSLAIGMLVGEVADRYMLPNKLLFFCHLVSAVALLLIPAQIADGHAWPFLALLAINTTFGDSTVPICTRMAFHALKDDLNQFAIARAIGTAGWLVAGLVTGFSGVSASLVVFDIAAVASFVMAAFVLILPATPSSDRSARFSFRDLIGWDALAMMREPSFCVFIIVAVAIFFPMSAYNAYLPIYLQDNHVKNVGGLMTLAQVTEIGLMFSLAYSIRLLGIRNIITLACAAWMGIMVLFALGDNFSFALIVIGILMHGLGWDFFYASSEVYLNSKSSEELKSRGQALLRTATFGLGTILGGLLSGWFYNSMWHAGNAVSHWPRFWGTIGIVPVMLMIAVLVFFREGKTAIISGAEKDIGLPLTPQPAP